MIVWRLVRRPHTTLDGEGGRRFSGRWHHRGSPIIYTASTLSLATLEALVHLEPAHFTAGHIALEIHIPDELAIAELDVNALPPDWQAPEHQACREAGDAWLRAGATAVLRVPSAVVPREYNYLINPVHPDARSISIVRESPFSFDPRLAH